MAKRFIQPDWKQLRKLNEKLQRAWFYLWDQCDDIGVYHYDPDYLKLDLKITNGISLSDLSKLPECEILPGERILIKNFITVNYTNLKHNYNPHKPAFRDLDKNNLKLNLSLNQASLKLEEEEEDKDKDEGEEEGGLGEGFFVNELPKDTELTNLEINEVINFIQVACNGKIITEKDVGDRWRAFKIDNFKKREWYASHEKLISHFRHSLKNELNKNGHSATTKQHPVSRSDRQRENLAFVKSVGNAEYTNLIREKNNGG